MMGEGRIHTKGKKVGHCRVSQRLLSMIVAMKLLAVAFVWFLMQTCTEHQEGKFRPKNAIFFPLFTIKLTFCYLNIISKNLSLITYSKFRGKSSRLL